MARRAKAAGVMRLGGLVLSGAWLLFAPLPAQTPLTVAQAAARTTTDFAPLHQDQRVVVRGRVALGAIHFLEYTLLAIQEGPGGIAVRVNTSDPRLDAFQSGDEVEVSGAVSAVAGMPAILPDHLQLLAHGAPPRPVIVPLVQLQGFQYLGRLVQTEGRIVEAGETTAGSLLLLEAGASGHFKVFIPNSPRGPQGGLEGFAHGDKVRVTGIALQYCLRPPYNRWFQVLLPDAGQVVVVERAWFLPPWALAAALACAAGIVTFIWYRERRVSAQRVRLRGTYQLAEEILASPSAEAIQDRLSSALPRILGATGVRFYLRNRASRSLDAVGDASLSIPLAPASGGMQAAVAECFHYRTVLAIPEVARSPFQVVAADGARLPQSMLLVPMMAQGATIGVMELARHNRSRQFSRDERALAQHLGNHVGVALRLLDQRLTQEQLSRAEKLAAVGSLISGVVNELRSPLTSIAELAAQARAKPHMCPAEREVAAIGAESAKAGAIVDRLVSFAGDQVQTRPVEVNELLRRLLASRNREQPDSGVRVRDLTSSEPLTALGSAAQLEQTFRSLLTVAERSAEGAADQTVTVRTSRLARRILVEMSFSAGAEDSTGAETATVLGMAHGIVAGHGGEVRVSHNAPNHCIEIDLPLASGERPAATQETWPAPGHPATALLIEPDEAARRQIRDLLASRNHRVVPVSNSDSGLELAERFRFDLVLCSVRSPGRNWVELSELMRPIAGAFALLSEGYDAKLAADFEAPGRFVLPKPVRAADLDRVLGAAAVAATAQGN